MIDLERITHGRPVEFSYWPMRRGAHRYGLHTRVFTGDPWILIQRSIETKCPAAERSAARAFLDQARAFYRSAVTAGTEAAKPLLLYYCLLNLAKSFILLKGQRTANELASNVQHGLSEQMRTGGQSMTGAFLRAFPSGTTINMFSELMTAVCGVGLPATTEYDVVDLLPQVVTGHRLWAAAEDRNERFIAVERLLFMHDPSSRRMWFQLHVLKDDLTRLGVGHSQLLREAGLAAGWQQVSNPTAAGERRVLCYEQRTVLSYSHRPSDEIPNLVQTIRPHLWASVRTISPYRQYYLFRQIGGIHPIVQQLSVYALIYYFGSVTRYRPQDFDSILRGPYGPLIETLLNEQPLQLLYLLASDFAEQEIVRPAVV